MKKNEATRNRKEGHVLEDVVVFTDIDMRLEQLRREKEWKSDRNAITIYKSGSKTQTLISLHKGAALDANKFNGTATIIVLQGSLAFTSDPANMELRKGQMVTIRPGIEHSLRAAEESSLLLIKDDESVL
jgi:quercetin dioxygenase-like cupin family protein